MTFKAFLSLAFTVLFVLFAGGCDSTPTHSEAVQPIRPDHVEYILVGGPNNDSSQSIEVDITVKNESGGTEQNTVSTPWRSEFDVPKGQTRFLYLSAQNQGSGWVRTFIKVNGNTLQEAESRERFGIASVRGSCCN